MLNLRDLIISDMKPALGVTEPAAIALACAKARSLTKEAPVSVTVRVNSGIYKNAFTCGIPGTAQVGNEYSAALGIVCGDPERGLCLLESVDDAAVRAAEELVASGRVKVELDSISSVLYIGATVKTEHDVCVAELRGSHTNFTLIQRNGEVLLEKSFSASEAGRSPITDCGVSDLYDFALSAPLEELLFMREAYAVNLSLAEAGVAWERCVFTKKLMEENGGALISSDLRLSAKTLACAAAEARVLGIDKAAMSITGSGTHGIICTLPLYVFCKIKDLPEEKLLRATAISYLVTMYIKEFSGKLSAFCGCGIAGGTGLACALTYLLGGDKSALEGAMNNMAASITGMICSGGNHCCALKVISAVDAAFNCATLAISGAAIEPVHGICGATPEATARHIGLIADPGMVETERVIVEIMQNK